MSGTLSDAPPQLLRDALWHLSVEFDAMERSLESLQLSPTQARVLMELGRGHSRTASELADRVAVNKSTMSRSLGQLDDAGLISVGADERDRRRQPISRSAKGKTRLAKVQRHFDVGLSAAVETARPQAGTDGLAAAIGMLARELRHNRLSTGFGVRPIKSRDNDGVAEMLRSVMPEFGADGDGTSGVDEEIDAMCEAYRGARAGYWIVQRGDRIVGGGGFAPLSGGPADVCELRKMYFASEARGRGLGRRLLELILAAAAEAGYRRCYAETLTHMAAARRLYEQNDFRQQAGRLGDTGHPGCNTFYLRKVR